ncbi:hypothetical protein DFP86_10527 [Paludibacterium purpuratum]|uniref:Oxidoreductase molybdopterin-binding domain-containing protein n=2 Tax=Paludibacterium purpuratum TaxID=1144873 RepID=A0A4R7B6S9_9NEIS|nr:hypothetical protein DFP86_10527 [Paludibacterium purpuratum]
MLTIGGNVARPVVIRIDALNALPMHTITTRTPWAARASYTGPLLKDVLEWVGAHGQAVIFSAYDDYSVTIPVSDFNKYQVILAIKKNGKPLTVREKGPVRVVYPMEQFKELQTMNTDSKMIWYVNQIFVR